MLAGLGGDGAEGMAREPFLNSLVRNATESRQRCAHFSPTESGAGRASNTSRPADSDGKKLRSNNPSRPADSVST
jgi:hypothetical protein